MASAGGVQAQSFTAACLCRPIPVAGDACGRGLCCAGDGRPVRSGIRTGGRSGGSGHSSEFEDFCSVDRSPLICRKSQTFPWIARKDSRGKRKEEREKRKEKRGKRRVSPLGRIFGRRPGKKP